ncbi:MAG TPA: carbohydrate ABC transporter permease [Fimbriimonadaceae bacterium]|nr:carbohydrate ABC transporter permease [Fimbriimonadaceae bacterium]
MARAFTKLDARSATVYAMLVTGAALCLLPLLWTVSTALKSPDEVAKDPTRLIPHHFAFDNFAKAWTALPFTAFVTNTIFVTLVNTVATVLTASLVAYGFARFRFKGRNLLFYTMLATMMLPSQVTMAPVFMIWRGMHAIDTYWPLIVPSFLGGGAFNIFLLRQFLLTIPRELDEAAMLDGASYFKIWWKVLIPLSAPALATVSIFSFMGNWDSFDGPLIYLNSSEKYTVALGLRMFQDSYSSQTEQLMAASLIHILPMILIFFLAQRHFMKGVALTGMGGR